MTWLVATDSYKGSLSAAAASAAIARGLARAAPGQVIVACPLSDGGEGFVESLVAAGGGTTETVATTSAVGAPIEAVYGRLDGGETAVVELSSAAGLVQVPADRRHPLLTTTYGVGTVIAKAYRRRPFKKLLLGLGGSATVDGGAGLLSALGLRFLDEQGRELPPGGGALRRLRRIETAGAHPLLREAEIVVAVDVDNPLVGERGAAAVYGPQKGATPAMVAEFEAGLRRYAEVIAETTGRDLQAVPGTGAAGGVPAGLLGFSSARLVSGFDLVAQAIGLVGKLEQATLVVTGEGQLDRSSLEGKVAGRLGLACRARGIPIVALVGRVTEEGAEGFAALGGAAFTLVPGPVDLETAQREAAPYLERTATEIGRLLSRKTR